MKYGKYITVGVVGSWLVWSAGIAVAPRTWTTVLIWSCVSFLFVIRPADRDSQDP